VYADGYAVTNNFNLVGQLTNTIDSGNASVTNWFNNQGMLFSSSNALGQVFGKSFDILDRLTNSVDANGMVIAHTYDNLNRPLSSSYPDGGLEQWAYTMNISGPTGYTNQLNQPVFSGYDPAGRKIAETNALGYATGYAYDPAGNLTSLTNQNTNVTQWGYNCYGSVTNKMDASGTILKYQYDADNRLTNRWSFAKNNTGYGYDNVGNLTGVTYPVSAPLWFSYDAMNRMISMTDGIGTTTFTYTPVGQPASESGPWASDTVGYTYANRLRMSRYLQRPNASEWLQSYGYDAGDRLQTTTSPAGSFVYTYNMGVAGTSSASSLIAKVVLPNGAFITNTYDNKARVIGTWLYNGSLSNLDSSVYAYNLGDQRTNVTRSGENTADYTYDLAGQVIADQAFESNGTARLNEQLHYAFDPRWQSELSHQ
jgi:YD repeat-containing protein